MQTRRHSRFEVGIDLLISLMVNIGAQILFYGKLATASRSLTLAVVILTLAVPRRYLIRRLFNARLKPGTRQSRWHSWLEIIADTAVAICVAILIQWAFYGAAATWTKAGGLTGLIYAVTMVRRYILRRLFEVWAVRRQHRSMPERWVPGDSA